MGMEKSRIHIRFGSVVLFLGLTLNCFGAEQRGSTFKETRKMRFTQSEFAIGMWVEPPLDERADARYQELADANFTLVIGGFYANTPDKIREQIRLCEKYGLRLLCFAPGIAPNDLPDSPCIWGYGLRDEPSAKDFPELRKQVDAIRRARPGKLSYINLFPNYASLNTLGTATYEEYVSRFLEEVDVDVLSMDHYPLFKPDADGRDKYCENLDVMRRLSLQKGIPFWNFFNIMPFGPHTDPTEDQVRWQIFTSLAYGAKGVMYFCYYTPRGDEFPKGGAIIAYDGTRTRHWYQARRLNEQLRNLGPTLMNLTSEAVFRIGPNDDPKTVLKGSPITQIIHQSVDPPLDYLVGVFGHKDGRRAVLLNNYRFAYTAWPTIEFDVSLEQVVEVDPWTGKEVPVRDDSPDMDGLQISLDAGGGRLFLLPAR